MKQGAIWVIVGLLAGIGLFLLGRSYGVQSCNATDLDALGNTITVQAGIERDNATVTQGVVAANEHSATVAAVVQQERKNHDPDHPACHVSRGDVQLLNAQRSNQLPDTLALRAGDSAYSIASTVSQQTLIDGDIDCARRYNAIKVRCEGVFAKIKIFQAAQHAQ